MNNQVEYSLLHRKPEVDGVLDACRELGITLIAYSPLAGGRLTGKYSAQHSPSGFFRHVLPQYNRKTLDAIQLVINLLREIGEHYWKTPSQVAWRWLIENPIMLPISGAKNGDRQLKMWQVWETAHLQQLHITEILNSFAVDLVSPNADKHVMAQCDLGNPEADYLLPETGTLVLKSSAEEPRAVSLLPRIHLAIVRPAMLRADLHQVFAESKAQSYLVFITGPSRTADIELTVTLGVHGPKNL